MEAMQEIYKRRWLIFAAITMTTFISCVDASSVNVALPGMADELGVTMAGIEWVVTAYTLVIICLILVFGKLGDTIGKDKVFKAGILGFMSGALVCFFAQNYTMLIIGRVVEGIGSAATMANSQGLIVQVFPVHERGKALGLSGSTVALGSMVGPSIGGFIVSFFNWNYIFAMNVPIALLSFLLCCKYLPKFDDEKQDRRIDFGGALLFMAMILCVYGGVKLLQAGSSYYLYCMLILASAALLVLSTLGVESSLTVFLIGSVMLSIGNAMFQSPNTSLIMSTVAKNQTGVAGSINGLARNLGSVFGISLSTVLLYNMMSSQLGFTVMSFIEGEELAFVTAMQWVYRFMACISMIGAVLTGLRWKNRREQKHGLD